MTYCEVQYRKKFPRALPDCAETDYLEMLNHWLDHHFKLGAVSRSVTTFVIEFLHLQQSDHFDLRFSRYPGLRAEGVKAIREDIFIEDLLAEHRRCRANPFRFANSAKKWGYLFTFSLSTLCWFSILTWTIQFYIKEDLIEEELGKYWVENTMLQGPMDAFFYQPICLLGMAYFIYWAFAKCLPPRLVHAKLIQHRENLTDALVALHEEEVHAERALDSAGGPVSLDYALELAQVKSKKNKKRRKNKAIKNLVKHEAGPPLA